MKRKIIILLTLFFGIINSYSYGIYTPIPIWSENTVEVNSETVTENFFNIQSESAILIEQTTRKNSI